MNGVFVLPYLCIEVLITSSVLWIYNIVYGLKTNTTQLFHLTDLRTC